MFQSLLGRSESPLGRKMSPKLVAGFRSTLAKNGLKDHTDPATSEIARLIIQIAKDGERDPAVLAIERPLRIGRYCAHCGGWAHGPLPLSVWAKSCRLGWKNTTACTRDCGATRKRVVFLFGLHSRRYSARRSIHAVVSAPPKGRRRRACAIPTTHKEPDSGPAFG
jgi:hypothetical protein